MGTERVCVRTKWRKEESNWVEILSAYLLDPDAHSGPFVERQESHLHPPFLARVRGEPARGTEGQRGREDGGVVEGVAGGHADVGLRGGREGKLCLSLED